VETRFLKRWREGILCRSFMSTLVYIRMSACTQGLRIQKNQVTFTIQTEHSLISQISRAIPFILAIPTTKPKKDAFLLPTLQQCHSRLCQRASLLPSSRCHSSTPLPLPLPSQSSSPKFAIANNPPLQVRARVALFLQLIFICHRTTSPL
jgi:hypothetical protein